MQPVGEVAHAEGDPGVGAVRAERLHGGHEAPVEEVVVAGVADVEEVRGEEGAHVCEVQREDGDEVQHGVEDEVQHEDEVRHGVEDEVRHEAEVAHAGGVHDAGVALPGGVRVGHGAYLEEVPGAAVAGAEGVRGGAAAILQKLSVAAIHGAEVQHGVEDEVQHDEGLGEAQREAGVAHAGEVHDAGAALAGRASTLR